MFLRKNILQIERCCIDRLLQKTAKTPEILTKHHKGRLDLGHNLLVIQKMLLR